MMMARLRKKFNVRIRRDQTVPSDKATIQFFFKDDVEEEALDMWIESLTMDGWQRFDHDGGVFLLHVSGNRFDTSMYDIFRETFMRQHFYSPSRYGSYILSAWASDKLKNTSGEETMITAEERTPKSINRNETPGGKEQVVNTGHQVSPMSIFGSTSTPCLID